MRIQQVLNICGVSVECEDEDPGMYMEEDMQEADVESMDKFIEGDNLEDESTIAAKKKELSRLKEFEVF